MTMKGACTWILSLLLLPLSVVSKCPNDCSQHGLCSGPGPDAFCICEGGFVRDDCSEMLCPKGDDPVTVGQSNRQISISTGAKSGQLAGHFDFTFMGQAIGFDATATALSMKYAMESIPSVGDIEIRRGGTTSDGGSTYTLTFLSWPKGKPLDNNLYEHDGFPPLSFFKCTTEGISGAVKPFCELRDVGELDPAKVVEHVQCSNHGSCDEGECICHRGWSGELCDDNADDEDLQVMYAEGPFFSGVVAKIATHKKTGEGFDFMKVTASDDREDVLTLDGYGDMTLHKGKLIVDKGDISVRDGDIAVSNGQIQIRQGSFELLASTQGGGVTIMLDSAELDRELAQLGLGNSMDDGQLIGVEYDYKSLFTVGAPMMTMADLLSSDEFSGFDYVSIGPMAEGADAASRQGMSLRREHAFFRIDNNGKCTIGRNKEEGSGGDGGGLNLRSGDFVVNQGDSMFNGNVEVTKSLVVNGSDGINLNQGPLIVRSGNSLIRSPIKSQPALMIEAIPREEEGEGDKFQTSLIHMSIPTELIDGELKNKASFMKAAIQHEESLGSMNGNIDIDGEEIMFEVSLDGSITSNGGLKLSGGGVHVESGGVNVKSGGLKVHGGVDILSGGLEMNTPEGFQVNQGGFMSVSNSSGTSPILAKVNNEHFFGSVLQLETVGDQKPEDFNYLLVSKSDSTEALASIDGFGTVTGSNLMSKGDARIEQDLILNGHAILSSKDSAISAGALIIIPPCGESSGNNARASSFIKITSDGTWKANKLTMPLQGSDNCKPSEGQLLLIYNGDEDVTSGEAAIPPGRAVLFIFSEQAGPGWVPFTTLDARGSQLEKISLFTALNDLDIGSFAFKAKQLIASGQIKGQVAHYGSGGLLTGDTGLTFNNGLLTTNKINMKQVDSNGVDFMGTPLTNIRVESGSITGITTLRTNQIFVESLRPVGTLLVTGESGSITSSSSVFVSELEKSGVSGADTVSTLVTPSVRVSGLDSGSIVTVGVHGELSSFEDLKVNFISNINLETGDGAEVSVQRAAELKLNGASITAELHADRVSTSTLLGSVPTQAQLNAMQAIKARKKGANKADTAAVHSGRREVRVFGDLVMDGYELRGAAIVGSSLQGVEELGVTTLTMKHQQESSLAYFAANSTLQAFTGSHVNHDGVLNFETLGIKKLANNLDCNGFELNNAKLSGGSLEAMVRVSTKELELTSLASSSSSSASISSFALLDSTGKIHTTSHGNAHGLNHHGFSYDMSKQTLHVPKLGEHELGGDVDGKGNVFKNVIIDKSEIVKAVKVESDGHIGCKGDMDVGGDASITGTLVVGGTVMGSGPYVDSSDERFKMKVEPLFNEGRDGLDTILKLRPVKYHFNLSSHPTKQFPTGQEIGFIAQEIEQHIPEIVTTDSNGYKGVAYSKLTPVLVSAVQDLSAKVKELSEENEMLKSKVNEIVSNQDKLDLMLESMKYMRERIASLEDQLSL